MTLVSPRLGVPLQRLEGSAGSMSYWNGAFTRIAGELDTLRASAQGANELAGIGAAIISARSDAAELVAALAPDIAEAELLASVLQQYADAFQGSAEPANRLIDDIEDADAEWQRLAGEAEHAGLQALSASRLELDSATADNEAAGEAIGDRDRAKTALDDLWAEWDAHYEAWDTAYDAALSQLAGSGPALTGSARDFLDELLAAGGPAEVLRLWNEHPELRAEISAAHPEIIGNLDGIPYDVRHAANAQRLEEVRDSEPDEPMRTQIEALWVEVIYNGGALISFDPDGSGQLTAAVAYGNVATAEDVSVLISGMNSSVGDLPSWAATARQLNAAVDDARGTTASATVVWFGYDTPNELEEPAMQRAEDGAAALASFLQPAGGPAHGRRIRLEGCRRQPRRGELRPRHSRPRHCKDGAGAPRSFPIRLCGRVEQRRARGGRGERRRAAVRPNAALGAR